MEKKIEMEFGRMGFDLTLLVCTIFGNIILGAVGIFLIVHFLKDINRWKKKQAYRESENTDLDNYVSTTPVSHAHNFESPPPLKKPESTHPSQESAH